ncbi:lysozyme [Burkholderia vietnamiensis]|uniref:lysozyme n=1 Tax=Burkholderia vietnamiensis TaxID=60552 RepID=UPI001593E2F7|nr:lysozyme [Burkholderia vietnamiensis]MBR8006523.1 lysozyme [Burkholderia vietnamiensis]MDN7814731.1 lysozyme [Burkholderia vietnamiensis]MDN8042322.1 lysozyme [Burkholderia vietnamiensis]HDR9131377.1 lysozyme [Burkholderia vietnamiensis]
MARVSAAVIAAALAISVPLTLSFEGTRPVAYRDPVGIPTACTGHTGADVRVGRVYSPKQCTQLLNADSAEAMGAVLDLTTGPINANELAALTDFTFNVGRGNLASSTLLRKFNAGDRPGACKELLRWVYAKGVKLNGLVRRRQAEYEVCMK